MSARADGACRGFPGVGNSDAARLFAAQLSQYVRFVSQNPLIFLCVLATIVVDVAAMFTLGFILSRSKTSYSDVLLQYSVVAALLFDFTSVVILRPHYVRLHWQAMSHLKPDTIYHVRKLELLHGMAQGLVGCLCCGQYFLHLQEAGGDLAFGPQVLLRDLCLVMGIVTIFTLLLDLTTVVCRLILRFPGDPEEEFLAYLSAVLVRLLPNLCCLGLVSVAAAATPSSLGEQGGSRTGSAQAAKVFVFLVIGTLLADGVMVIRKTHADSESDWNWVNTMSAHDRLPLLPRSGPRQN
ncbi:unnamed protein product [Amoebophrya sp. A120]|nr:unnamed protein product [Amoebophrya sp. A120]|eukprot:GSA120T00016763001.1